jgi:small subunit ribosomal protein S16
MLAIRFQRIGRKNDPAFRIVVAERRSRPKSGELEILGSYHPKTKETVLKTERILYWLSQGAKPSPTVHNLLVSKEIIQGRKINVVRIVPSTQAVPLTQAVPSSEGEKSKEEAREN